MAEIVRVYTGSDDLTHIEKVDLPMESFVDTEGAYGLGTPFLPASGITFRESPSGYFLDWHNAPRRQYTITLTGEAEIEASDGTTMRVGPGDILLAEDLTGKGHTTRVVSAGSRLYVVVALGE